MQVMTLIVAVLLGGVALAVSLRLAQQYRSLTANPPSRRDSAILIDAINIAHIPVDGVGGLGLVAMAVVIALSMPSIGVPIFIAVGTGTILAAVLILSNRGRGPLPSITRRVFTDPDASRQGR